MKFRDFVCLTQGDTITIKTDLHSNPEFKFDIVDIKPESAYKTVSIINCDLNLDFEAPLDYEEPATPKLEKHSSSVVIDDADKEEKTFSEFTGKCQRLDGKAAPEGAVNKKEEYDPRKFRLPNGVRKETFVDPFTGKGIRIK